MKQDCFPLMTSTSNVVNKNDFVNNLSNRMCGPVKVNLVYSENCSSSKGPVTTAAVNKTPGRIRKAPVTESNAFLW